MIHKCETFQRIISISKSVLRVKEYGKRLDSNDVKVQYHFGIDIIRDRKESDI